MALRRALLALLTLWPLATASLAPARAAEQDICENRTGPDLVRCIEASARGTPVPPAPTRKPAAEVPPPARTGATVALPEPPGYAAQPAVPPEDCTGRTGPALRTCLAAGGRLSPSAAVVPAPSAAPSAPAAAAPESCDGKSGDALRTCLEHAARSPMKPDRNRRLVCTGYTVADQPLCVHRNTAIDECRNRTRYPDFDVCMRSQMVRAPEPKRADCTKVSARARGHCEARNRVYEQCLSDRTGYFGCLERQLGADAVLSRR
jgi:hypothetical protein